MFFLDKSVALVVGMAVIVALSLFIVVHIRSPAEPAPRGESFWGRAGFLRPKKARRRVLRVRRRRKFRAF